MCVIFALSDVNAFRAIVDCTEMRKVLSLVLSVLENVGPATMMVFDCCSGCEARNVRFY